MTLRKAGKKDIPDIYALIHAATERGRILKRSRKEIQKTIRHFWVTEEDGNIVACCALEIYNKKLAEVRSLAVAPHHQEKGIGSALLGHCITEARKKGIYEVLAITDRENLFKRLGFSEQLHGQKALFLRP